MLKYQPSVSSINVSVLQCFIYGQMQLRIVFLHRYSSSEGGETSGGNSRRMKLENEQCLNSEDCLKTFCTEGTPYNFSNSTSMSDLREAELENGTAGQNPNSSCIIKVNFNLVYLSFSKSRVTGEGGWME